MRSQWVKAASFVLAAATAAMAVSAIGARADVSPSASPSAAAAIVTSVDTKDFAYKPATLTVPTGTKVTFKNSDAIAHTVTALDKSFDSGNLDQNATWSHVFDKAGTYKYTCTYHAYMHGTVVVK